MTQSITRIDATQLRIFLLGGCNNLDKSKDAVNALNVFPVPDGDTGINMYLTVSSGAKKLEGISDSEGIGKLAAEFSMGSLMGARGNSGVILSQMIRGCASALSGKETATAADLAAALKKGVDLSYKSVMKPVEGTILTVFRQLAAAAENAARNSEDILEILDIALKAGDKALADTPRFLPVLKEAGVVDAGGQGLLCFMQGGYAALSGKEPLIIPPSAPVTTVSATTPAAARSDISTADITYSYCTQLLIKGENLNPETVREHLSKAPAGDSLLVVGDENIIKLHFHTNNPGQVLEYCGQFGSLHDIIIDNMRDQHHENMISAAEADATAAVTDSPVSQPKAPCGVVAVVAGEGMAEIFRELGVDVISGGQTMNPSAEDLLQAIEACAADEVVILPNNSNIILTAEQVCHLTEKPVCVVRSKYVTQGLSALLCFNPMNNAEQNAAEMSEAMMETVNGELTYAVRDTKFNGFDIKENDLLALLQGDIFSCGQELYPILLELLEQMVLQKEDPSMISLYYGEDIDEEQAQEIADQLAEHFPDLEVELYYGGQPLYYFLLSVD